MTFAGVGLNTDLREVVLSSAIGDGATRKWVDRDMRGWDSSDPRTMSSLRRVQNYISVRQAPKYPFSIDSALAAQGAPQALRRGNDDRRGAEQLGAGRSGHRGADVDAVAEPNRETSWFVLAQAARLCKVPLWKLEPERSWQPESVA